MKYTNSDLVSCTILSPNHSGQRTHEIDRITPHCVVGQATAERIGEIFTPTSKQASCNYGIGRDGRIVLVVEEKNRSWCSSSRENDQRAITIEVASDSKAPYAFRDEAYAALIMLCIDICKRNGKKKLLWFADKARTLAYEPKADEMVLSVHRWFAAKSCMGPGNDTIIDHINHDKTDNRKCNLRPISGNENQWNAKKASNNTSGVTGVFWDSSRQRWLASLFCNGKTHHLGRFDSFDDAVAARKAAEEKFFGQYSYDNSMAAVPRVAV